MFGKWHVIGACMVTSLAAALATPGKASAPVPVITGSLAYDTTKRIVIDGTATITPCTGFGCGQPCAFTFFCPPGESADVDAVAPLQSCGGSTSAPILLKPAEAHSSSNGATADATVSADGNVVAFAGPRSVGATFDLNAFLTADAHDNGCQASPPPPGASANAAAVVSVDIPFTVTSNGEYSLVANLSVSQCDQEQATGFWSIMGHNGSLVVGGPIGADSHAEQGTVAPGNYIFHVTFASSATACVCSPCGGSGSAACAHQGLLSVNLVVVPCMGDINGDGQVSTPDLLALLSAWSPPGVQTCPPPQNGACAPDCPADLNGDGVVDTRDMNLLLANWGPC